MKQQRIMKYFNKKDKSKGSETGNCQNRNEASISRPTVSVKQNTKRAYSNKSTCRRRLEGYPLQVRHKQDWGQVYPFTTSGCCTARIGC